MYLNHRIELESDSRPTSNLNLETTHQLHNPVDEYANPIQTRLIHVLSACSEARRVKLEP